MKFLSVLFAKYKATIYAALAVLALTSTAALVTGAYNLGKQREQLSQLADANKKWVEAWSKMNQVREIEQKNMRDLQERWSKIETAQSATGKVKELEKRDEKVRDYRSIELTDDHKRLLDGR